MSNFGAYLNTKINNSRRMPWFDNFCRGFIREGHSLMAIDSEQNELVGLSITHECKREFNISCLNGFGQVA